MRNKDDEPGCASHKIHKWGAKGSLSVRVVDTTPILEEMVNIHLFVLP